jgi:hypothetical protein
MTEKTTHAVDATRVARDEILALTYYVKVKQNVSYGQVARLHVDDLHQGIRDITVEGRELIGSARSADQFAETQNVSMTKATELLVGANGHPFAVTFKKADGSERKLRGRLLQPEPLLGRSMVEDLDEPAGKRIRQVDHRTISSLILDGVRYVVK